MTAILRRMRPIAGIEQVLTSAGLLEFVNGEVEISDEDADKLPDFPDIRVSRRPDTAPLPVNLDAENEAAEAVAAAEAAELAEKEAKEAAEKEAAEKAAAEAAAKEKEVVKEAPKAVPAKAPLPPKPPVKNAPPAIK